ncbi:hypothetical protein N799_05290 [Lysobacter arseniciresistens ZS79]|uniref:Uncharacterized protein n=1 Tax=Lysobacter arseniciresistens ZS79 TaxID=913325 RepID=A0A0A0F537_9GAMM|nr:hypothetical protein [Lysobacter arseniciresistens]KGM57483.1 hypothetical protein N799_05290 [Lysobacter arseniciresistens ZS79]
MSILSILPFAMFTPPSKEPQDEAGLLAHAIENSDIDYLDMALDEHVYVHPRFAQMASEIGEQSIISRIRKHMFTQNMNAPVRIV